MGLAVQRLAWLQRVLLLKRLHHLDAVSGHLPSGQLFVLPKIKQVVTPFRRMVKPMILMSHQLVVAIVLIVVP